MFNLDPSVTTQWILEGLRQPVWSVPWSAPEPSAWFGGPPISQREREAAIRADERATVLAELGKRSEKNP